MARQNPNPYLVLGVSPTATQAEITHAYRTRLRAHHPDTRHPAASKTDDDDDLRQVLAAYAVLRNPERRADHDRASAHAAPPPPHGPPRPTPVARIQIPITYHSTTAAAAHVASPPLRAGPVRRHR